jgi:hypothetical protein
MFLMEPYVYDQWCFSPGHTPPVPALKPAQVMEVCVIIRRQFVSS